MIRPWCLVGNASGEVLTYQGRVITHEDKSELEYLFPNNRVVPLPSYYGEGLTMRLRDHPDMDTVRFPLARNMNQFKRGEKTTR